MKIFTLILIASAVLVSSVSLAQPGTLDSTFGGDGKVITHFGDYKYGGGFSLALQDDGKIIVAGASSDSRKSDFAVARYKLNGELDSTFDEDGKVTTDFNNRDDRAFLVYVQADQKYLWQARLTVAL